MEDRELIAKAREAKEFSYSPYSGFRVGAALLGKNGKVYQGRNIENAAYTPTNCAERTAVFNAVSQGVREFEAIAVVGDGEDCLAPCGVCRQVLMEFVNPSEFYVLMAGSGEQYKKMTLEELFPAAFSPANLEKKMKSKI